MTAHRTTPDETGARVVVLTSHERPGEVVIGAGSGAVFVTLAERVPLAQAVAGDEYVVVKRAVIEGAEHTLNGLGCTRVASALRKAMGSP